MTDLIPALAKGRTKALTENGLIDFWIELCAREAENDGVHTDEDRVVAVTMLCDLWMTFNEHIDANEAQVTTIVFMLKRAVRDHSKCLRIPAVSQVFRILEAVIGF